MHYSRLDHSHLIATVGRLRDRIHERFPVANLARVADELRHIVDRHAERSARIRRPSYGLRLLSAVLLVAGIGLIGWLLTSARMETQGGTARTFGETVQLLEAGLSMLFFLAAGAIYVTSLELRHKRRRCLEALHELRALAHIVDMHQLAKDPERALHPGNDTASSPERHLTPFELVRYLDYCSELLALVGKVGALYAQEFPDPQAVDAVDDIEDLTTGLSRKIWQKITILTSHLPAEKAP
ncbi:MAG: hypothetical protein JNK15_20335 [Planctomycetes bacterium]|nr:hypothetical protein [Planctomycetota bacterium]